MVISPVVVLRQRALTVSGASELTPPDDERLVQQTALFQILNEGPGWPVDLLRLAADKFR